MGAFVGILWLVGGTVLALVLGGLAFVITAIAAPSVGVALGVGGMIGGVVLLVIGFFAFGRIIPAWRLIAAEVYLAAVLLFVGASVWSVISQPVAFQATPLAVPNVRYWDLPGNTRIAYVRLDPPGIPNPVPVIYLHGGPGFVGSADAELLRPLADAGFTVYAYDQVGSGLSNRLALPSDYTVERHLRDLAAIRAAIGASSVHLVGHSYGATLAAHSVANQGDWVNRVVFLAPGPLSPESVRANPTPELRLPPELRAQLAADRDAVLARGGTRWSLWSMLQQLSLNVAHSYIGDLEADGAMEALLAATQRYALCDPTRPFPRPTIGAGLYAHFATRQNLAAAPDVRPRLGAAFTPALIVRGDCDYMPWSVALEYRDSVRQARTVVIANGGHHLLYDQARPTLETVAAFLADRPLPLPEYLSRESPPQR